MYLLRLCRDDISTFQRPVKSKEEWEERFLLRTQHIARNIQVKMAGKRSLSARLSIFGPTITDRHYEPVPVRPFQNGLNVRVVFCSQREAEHFLVVVLVFGDSHTDA